MTKLLVIGSANIDHVMEFDCLPKAGETLMSEGYRIEHGGKGANQAVACARLKGDEAEVSFICALGCDDAAAAMMNSWRLDGIALEQVKQFDNVATGSAMIFVGGNAENSIGVASGANSRLSAQWIGECESVFESSDSLLIQLETPLESVKAALQLARKHKCKTILNPAPAARLDAGLLSLVDIITPNETEAEALTGVRVTDLESAERAAAALHSAGVSVVIITLGAQGAFLSEVGDHAFKGLIKGYDVTPVDTVAAGDTFNGALMVGLSEGMEMIKAIDFANQSAAIAVTRHGAQRGIPKRSELSEVK
ncbi:ribokinase [Shewanella sp. UCD-KL12]|uniref:ribokinase n=1 Tax=Shewanella sp. UCD-KL12 TaxID=1917163 RepID=UPI000970B7CF|nr:ribokinase [Shewanella sp. UCD-KL12]